MDEALPRKTVPVARFRRGAIPVRLENGRLESVERIGFGDRVVEPSPELLEEFCELAHDDSDGKVVRFARRYGFLGLCRHELPAAHSYTPYEETNTQGFYEKLRLRPRQRSRCTPSRQESVAAWRRFATEARALRRIAFELSEGRVGSGEWTSVTAGYNEAWEPWVAERSWSAYVYKDGEKQRKQTIRQRVKVEREALVWALQTWLDFGLVRPEFVWSRNKPTFRLSGGLRGLTEDGGYGQLFAAIAVQLMLDVSRPSSLRPCDGCGGLVTNPRRKPREDQRAFCEVCRASPRVPNKFANRDYRARKPGLRKK